MKTIEYFYSAHSGYAYIGSKMFIDIAKTAGRSIDHRPMDLRAVIASWPGAHNRRTPQHSAYFSVRQIQRWAEYRGAEIMSRPTHHDNEIALSNGVLIAGLLQGLNIDALTHRFLEGHWRDDADLANSEDLAKLCADVDIDAAPLLAAARSPEVVAVHDTNTAEAIARSVFGSPTYFVDGDMFYGQDHLELIAQACEKPFKGVWPPD